MSIVDPTPIYSQPLGCSGGLSRRGLKGREMIAWAGASPRAEAQVEYSADHEPCKGRTFRSQNGTPAICEGEDHRQLEDLDRPYRAQESRSNIVPPGLQPGLSHHGLSPY